MASEFLSYFFMFKITPLGSTGSYRRQLHYKAPVIVAPHTKVKIGLSHWPQRSYASGRDHPRLMKAHRLHEGIDRCFGIDERVGQHSMTKASRCGLRSLAFV